MKEEEWVRHLDLGGELGELENAIHGLTHAQKDRIGAGKQLSGVGATIAGDGLQRAVHEEEPLRLRDLILKSQPPQLLDHTTPHHTTPHHTTPHHTTPHRTTPHHTTPHHSTLRKGTSAERFSYTVQISLTNSLGLKACLVWSFTTRFFFFGPTCRRSIRLSTQLFNYLIII